MSNFTTYSQTDSYDTDGETCWYYYQPVGQVQLTANEVGSYIEKAYRPNSKSAPLELQGVESRTYSPMRYMYLITTAEDWCYGEESPGVYGSNTRVSWLEQLCDKCESALSEEE